MDIVYKGSKWRLGRSEWSRDEYRKRRYGQPRGVTPRAKETYRFDRRNHSILNRDEKNWHGTETKLRPEPGGFILDRSDRGETHFIPAPPWT